MTEIPIDRAAALAAVSRLGVRVADEVAAIRDPHAPTRGLTWTLGATAAHVAAGTQYRRAWLRGEGRPDYGIPTIADENQRRIDALGESDPGALATMIRDDTAVLVREAEAQRPGAVFPAEVGPPASLEVLLCVHLGELVVHGYDIATTLGRPWPIGRDDANLVASGGLSILPQFVDAGRARGAWVTYDLRLRGGGPRAIIEIRDGALSVEPAKGRTPIDCHISADPVAFLLVGYGRVGQWRPILRGGLVAWGRRPWAGLRFSSYLRNP